MTNQLPPHLQQLIAQQQQQMSQTTPAAGFQPNPMNPLTSLPLPKSRRNLGCLQTVQQTVQDFILAFLMVTFIIVIVPVGLIVFELITGR